MLCDECGKNQASTHLTKIVNGQKAEYHLCESCATKHKDFGLDSPFSIHQLLAGLLDNITEGTKKVDSTNELKCSVCDLTYSKFKQTGKFGCSSCYESFREQLNPLFKRIHGQENHIGKIPKKSGGAVKMKRKIDKLKMNLNLAVEKEEFELAAKLRDEIKDILKEMNE